MIAYLPNDPLPGGKYNFSYAQLREDYKRFTLMGDDEFYENLLHVLHFACFVCYVKEIPTQRALADTGIVHELIHLLMEKENRRNRKPEPEVTDTSFQSVRDLFNRDCCLA